MSEQHSSSLDEALEDVGSKILHILEVTPYLTRAQIQVSLGPALPPKIWDPVLQELVKEDKIYSVERSTQTPSGRNLVKTIYHLPTFPYPPVAVAQLGMV